MAVSAEQLRKILAYDPETGAFTWLERVAQRVRVGDVAGSVSSSGYRYISINGQLHSEHRLAWLYVHGRWPTHADHINGNTCDNRIANLRDSSPSQNQANAKRRKDSTSGYKGVFRVNSRWGAHIQCQKKRRFLGVFDTPELAHAAYVAASATLFGDFARAA